jgi:hypothetical protein
MSFDAQIAAMVDKAVLAAMPNPPRSKLTFCVAVLACAVVGLMCVTCHRARNTHDWIARVEAMQLKDREFTHGVAGGMGTSPPGTGDAPAAPVLPRLVPHAIDEREIPKP